MKIILRVTNERITLAARTASRVLSDGYEWPDDGWAIIAYNHPDGATEATFSARKNKRSITIRELTQ